MLKKLTKNPEKANEIPLKDLQKLIEDANKAYYQDGKPIMSDDVYDLISDVLKKRNPNLVLFKYSQEQGKKERLPFRMGSQDKIRTPKEIATWAKKNPAEYLFQDKLDGCSFLYANGKLFTRGDGTHGRNITHLLQYIQSPAMPPDIAIAGELVISKKDFIRHGGSFATARAMVAGLINRDTFTDAILKHVQLIRMVAFELVERRQQAPSAQLRVLQSHGFDIPCNWKNTALTYTALENIFTSRRKKSQYDIDGIVIYADESHQRSTRGNPGYSIAFKTLLADQVKTTSVNRVEWNSSRLGAWKPIVHFDPVKIGGVTIRKATGHNPEFIQKNGIGVGAVLQIARSGDVIPYIHKVVKRVSPSCPPKSVKLNVVQLKQNEFFLTTIGVEGVKLRSLEKLGDLSLKQLLKLNKSDWIDALGKVNGNAAFTKIKSSIKDVPLLTALVASSCFPGLGRKTLAKVFDILLTWHELGGRVKKQSALKEQLLEVTGIQELTANKLVEGLSSFRKWLKQHPMVTISKSKSKPQLNKKGDCLKGELIVFSGFRDAQLKNTIIQYGGCVSDTLTKKTTILVVDKPSESSKVKKAREYNIKIILREKFLNICR